ncbi:MAG: 4-hydroxyphenylpyruvate dioxygenase [Synechococcales cyanobacterium T60_A2020_003]|nr:4-hydroxyphenylpyruvate dioxygenase [Synechococcales cyanobacterium T60_A2020_003]
MNIDHIQFCVDDALVWADRFARWFQLQIPWDGTVDHTQIAVVCGDAVCLVLVTPLSDRSPFADYRRQHPMGVVDVAFQVQDLDAAIAHAQAHGAQLRYPLQTHTSAAGQLRWVQYQGWGDLRHTLVERRGVTPLCPLTVGVGAGFPIGWASPAPRQSPISAIDHVVLNVAQGDLNRAIAQYEDWFGFQRQQSFTIQTPYSGLISQVLVHPSGSAQLPINEPTSPSSQIQEFLDTHRGAGVQHIALETLDILDAIASFRQQGLAFLPVPASYYEQLQQRRDCKLSPQQLRAIAQAEILVDWQAAEPDAIFWQTFTQPIFGEPTFFFEVIQRCTATAQGDRHANGFGEGNFQALFEAIEREQVQRAQTR